jgi:hypothetical protein
MSAYFRLPTAGTPEWQALFPGVNPPSEPVSGWAELMQKCWDHDASTRPTFSGTVGAGARPSGDH